MKLEHREIIRMVCATLLSLAIYHISTHLLEWGSTKCPWDTKKVKLIILIIIAIVAVIFLIRHYRIVLPKEKMHRHRMKVLYKTLQSQIPVSSSK